ncbi:signal peptidase II [Paenibacillus sp. GYB004]|uniref:signal peptidase II n=1 Tax=Paenibacillus sp. GYB004 TaxID=2994393 RepID=UPI002F961F3F
MYYYLVAISSVFLDQISKWKVVNGMENGQSIPLVEGVFHLTSHRNRGAAFGILQNQQWLFIVITAVVTIVILYFLPKAYRTQRRTGYALSMILGGALGNFFDRIFRGEVVDMLDFTLIDFPIFNVADLFITIGALIMVVDILLDIRKGAD